MLQLWIDLLFETALSLLLASCTISKTKFYSFSTFIIDTPFLAVFSNLFSYGEKVKEKENNEHPWLIIRFKSVQLAFCYQQRLI